jgi:hypothetical protein
VRFSDLAAPPLTGEKGGVLVLVAVWLPVLLIFVMLVVEVGNWFTHKRHLQLQADAAAFAGGGLFNACFGDPASGSTAIENEARRYSGDPAWAGPLGQLVYNSQVGGSNKGTVTVRINRKTYQVGGPPADDTIESGPCTAKMVDVKITEAALPWFFELNVVPAINARARVEVQQKESSAGSLPVGVPDNNPLSAAAIFVDEVSGGVLAVEPLTKIGLTTYNGESLVQWTGSSTSVNVQSSRVGVVVVMSGLATFNGSGTLAQMCGQPLVECYQGADVGPWVGLSFIHGYSTTGTGSAAAPIVRDAILYNVGCSDDSAPSFLLHAGCTVAVKAKVDFGTGTNDPTLPPAQNGVNAQLKIDGWGCPNSGQNPKGCVMTYNASGVNAGYWTTNGPSYPLMPANGVAHTIDLNWGTNAGQNRSGTFTAVQRSFSASTATSGPVEYISVAEVGPGANSLAFGSHSLSVTVGVKEALQRNTQDPNEPAVALKVVGGSQNQTIDCMDGANLRDELANGCSWQYAINHGTPCPAYNTFNAAGIWDCVRTQTGGQNGQAYQGMLDRTQGGSNTCVNPNNWVDSNGDGKITIPDDIPLGDPRIVPVFVTPFGSFNGNGNNVIPVVNFATFYVTGFSASGNGGGQGDPCPGASPVPGGGYIMGHFIKYVDTINSGGGGSPCNFGSFGSCVAVLTE